MYTNTYVLSKQLSALALALLFVACTALSSRAQQAPPHSATNMARLGQSTVPLVTTFSATNAGTLAQSAKKGALSAGFIITDGDDGGVPPPAGQLPGSGYELYDGSAPTPLTGDDGGTAPPGGTPGDGYERVVEAHPVRGIDGAFEQPSQAAALSNYPNPFNPETTIRFELRAGQPVHLAVYNALGQRVQVLVEGWTEAGMHEARFDAHGLSSGTYFTRLVTQTGVVTRTMVLAQ